MKDHIMYQNGRVNLWDSAAALYHAGYRTDSFREYEYTDGSLKPFCDEDGFTDSDLSGIIENLALIQDDPDLLKNWYLVDDATSTKSRCDEDRLNVATLEEAIAEAEQRWYHLTDSERRSRDAFFVCRAEDDEMGCLDYNTISDYYSFKGD